MQCGAETEKRSAICNKNRKKKVPVPDEVFERLTEEMACAEQAVKEAMPRGE